MKPDAVTEILKIVCAVAAVEPDAVSRADVAIRAEFGGRSVKISERAPVTLEQIDAGLRQRKTVAVMASEFGISRASIYRILGQRRMKVSRKRAIETPKHGK